MKVVTFSETARSDPTTATTATAATAATAATTAKTGHGTATFVEMRRTMASL
jgi:hypothetical protein